MQFSMYGWIETDRWGVGDQAAKFEHFVGTKEITFCIEMHRKTEFSEVIIEDFLIDPTGIGIANRLIHIMVNENKKGLKPFRT